MEQVSRKTRRSVVERNRSDEIPFLLNGVDGRDVSSKEMPLMRWAPLLSLMGIDSGQAEPVRR